MMRKLLVAVALCFIWAGMASAQKGTAEPGFYPGGFQGDTWTGEVTSINEDTREFTLTYTRKDKTQTFVGVLPKGYRYQIKGGKYYEPKMSNLKGAFVKAYYVEKERKVNGQKIKWNDVFDIKF